MPKQKLTVVLPFTDPQFAEVWQDWKACRYEQHNIKYKNPRSEQGALTHLHKLSEGNATKAIELISYSISRGWRGIWPLPTVH